MLQRYSYEARMHVLSKTRCRMFKTWNRLRVFVCIVMLHVVQLQASVSKNPSSCSGFVPLSSPMLVLWWITRLLVLANSHADVTGRSRVWLSAGEHVTEKKSDYRHVFWVKNVNTFIEKECWLCPNPWPWAYLQRRDFCSRMAATACRDSGEKEVSCLCR